MEYGNIVVLVQYRLGIMGFFHYQDADGVTHGGNYGLADMALGVKFVAENAAKLGGDSNHILINGESAGSGSVMALLLHDETGEFLTMNGVKNRLNLSKSHIRSVCSIRGNRNKFSIWC